MAVAVIGGVISSTLLSLIVVPVFYLAIENLKARLSRFGRSGSKLQPLPPVHPGSGPELDSPPTAASL
jgi:hypothetical protein